MPFYIHFFFKMGMHHFLNLFNINQVLKNSYLGNVHVEDCTRMYRPVHMKSPKVDFIIILVIKLRLDRWS